LTSDSGGRPILEAVSASFLVLDIETVLDPELPIPVTEAERLPPPPHHRVVVVGALLLDSTYELERLEAFDETKGEAGLLTEFADFLEERRPTLVTFNGRGFDMPVIATRCLRYGIPLRHYYRAHDVRYRFTAQGHLDLMDYVADFGAARPSRLDVIARLCGMPGKVGMEGKDVGPFVQAGRLTEVRNYCLCDVAQTAAVFLRVQLLRGELPRAGYLGAMRRLIDSIRSDERLAPVAATMNEKRLLLEA
jgi:predicted PolB exonuclease-like 3'-5' exonuclease